MSLCPRGRLLCRMKTIQVASLDTVRKGVKKWWRNCPTHGKIEGVENHHLDGSVCGTTCMEEERWAKFSAF